MTALTALTPVWPLDSGLDERGRLQLGGCDAIELAAQYGTPTYVVCARDVRERGRAYVDALRAEHAGPGLVLFALKALPVAGVLRLLADEGLGALASTGGELELALRAGVPADRIALHGNAKSHEEIAQAVDAGIAYLILDNAADVDKLERVLDERPGAAPQPVLLRVNPGVETDTHAAIMTGQDESKFGVAFAQAPALLERLAAHPRIDLRGLHAHIGSQLLDVGPYFDTARSLAQLGGYGTYDLGGGLGTAYTDEHPPAIADHVAAVARAARELLGDPAHTTLLLEPGRALVANAGVTLYRVESVKRNVHTWVGVDGGMSDNLRPMLYGARYEAELADRFKHGPEEGEGCRICGKHCESGDVLVQYARLREPAPGDVVALAATGAYVHAMANTYNCQPRPPVIMVEDGSARVAVRRETLDDLFARDQDATAR